jgi:hypothetical protein
LAVSAAGVNVTATGLADGLPAGVNDEPGSAQWVFELAAAEVVQPAANEPAATPTALVMT